MDFGETIPQAESPRKNANWLSVAFFWWLNPLLRKGFKQELQITDIYKVLKDDSSKHLGDLLSRYWNKEQEKSKIKPTSTGASCQPSLLKALASCFGKRFAMIGLCTFIEECVIRILQPLFMSWFISYYTVDIDKRISADEAYMYGTLLILMSVFYCFSHHIYYFVVAHIGMQIRIALSSMIYRKSLKLSKSALHKSTIGQMINLLSNDVNRFDSMVVFAHYLWAGPLQLLIAVLLTWSKIGPSTLAGATLILVFVPLQSWIGKAFSRLRLETAKKTDHRIKVMNEIINGIKVIKMYAWENAFSNLISKARGEEIDVIRKTCYYRSFNFGFFFTSDKLIFLALLVPFVWSGQILSAEAAFFCIGIYNTVRFSMTLFFPTSISLVSESLTCLKRIQDFLLLEENDVITNRTHKDGTEPLGKSKVIFKALHAKWDNDSNKNTLQGVSFETMGSEIVTIIGSVGSGKSSILHAVLGEIPSPCGTIEVTGTLSYSSQEPWIFFGSVRHNILFGEEFDEERYWKVIKVCALDKDLQGWEHGDSTLVGEKGVMLSGGQKARVNLARAIYRKADIYLLDDPLSAVDSQVGKHLFKSCIKEFLMEKLVILVTHQLQHIKHADKILVLKDGKIEACGTYTDILSSKAELSEFLTTLDDEENCKNEKNTDKMISHLTVVPDDVLNFSADLRKSLNIGLNKSRTLSVRAKSLQSVMSEIEHKIKENELKPLKDKKPEAIEEKNKFIGKVNFKTYWTYFSAGGSILTVPLLFFANFMTQIMVVITEIWVGYWTNLERDLELASNSNHSISSKKTYFMMFGSKDSPSDVNWNNFLILLIMTIVLVMLTGIRTLQHFLVCMKSSNKLHNNMFHKVTRAPTQFFDKNPAGRILNRFSKDMGSVDEMLPSAAMDVIAIYFVIAGVLFIVIFYQPYVLLPIAIVFAIFSSLKQYYLASSRAIKRLEGVSKSPIFTQLSSSLQGLTIIRAYKAETLLENEFEKLQDIHSSTWYVLLATARWFALRLELGVAMFFLSCILSLLFNGEGLMGGDVGVFLSSCILLSGMLQFGIRQSAEVENLMTSVERILEYGSIGSEADLETHYEIKKDKTWPSQGIIEFKNLSMKYGKDEPYILKEMNFKTQENEKIGIVGRTGAGKSSIIVALFRLSEPEGEILVDGKSICKMGLHEVRKKISIIPQDPILFSGTLRHNLDPFQEYQDVELWDALKQVNLDEAVKSMDGGLQSIMSEGGSNLSVGQRQLICLARAILRKNKILVLDEATANVDPKTDSLIQETIRQKFIDCTILTIAHRLHTVMDSDRIMVIDNGQVKEFADPLTLLEKPNGFLRELVESTDQTTQSELLRIAKDAKKLKMG